MTALRDEWQIKRQQRQQEAIARRQQVHSTLISIRDQRQDQATYLRADLDLFREGLALNDENRRAASAAYKAGLQQFRLQLQQETQGFLDSARDTRQQRAKQLIEQLDRYVEALQQQTSRFLSITQIERLLMAQQLTQDLQAFHADLSQAIVALRQANQTTLQEIAAQVKNLQANTQSTLAANYRQRLARQAQLTQDLTAFMQTLRSDVQDYLLELDLLRQSRAQQLQASLQQSHAQRLVAVTQLFDHLATFRTDLQRYHRGLHQSVWGQSEPQSTPPKGLPTSATKALPALARPRVFAPKSATPRVTAAKPLPAVVAKAAVAVLEPPAVKTLAGVSQKIPVAPPVPVTPFMSGPMREAADVEKAVYDYVFSTQGARLVEMETALKINRFQAVDALRSLIKKGLLIQRDRLYFIHETPNP